MAEGGGLRSAGGGGPRGGGTLAAAVRDLHSGFARVFQGRMLLKPAQMHRSAFILLAFGLGLTVCGGAPAVSAQDVNKAATETWRPKDGIYGDPRNDLGGWCEN